jgi:ABC-type multidrug transport system fused ATPase/permease subunit
MGGRPQLMYENLLRLVEPFKRDYARYLAGVFVRQTLVVAGGYSMVLALRLSSRRLGISELLIIAAFLAYDAGLLSLDISLNWFFSSRLAYPLFGKLRTAALAKVFEMPLEWHHQRESGRLAGEVNSGVGKVVQTAEGVSRELIPALIRTALSLVPLLVAAPLTAFMPLAALVGYVWLSILENRKREPLRRGRYAKYHKDHGLFSECVQQVRSVVQFGQTRRMLSAYGQLQQAIAADGLEETRIGAAYWRRRHMLLCVTKRLCQGMWLYQFHAGALDGALVMYLSMLLEELLNSFSGYAVLLDRIFDGLEPACILVSLLDEQPKIATPAGARPQSVPAQVGIRMVDLGFAYGGRREVVRNLNLTIEPGTIVGVVGRSGGGKTTLHHLISRMYDIRRGSIEICGADIRKWPLEQLRGLFSYVTQDGGVFFSEMTLADTIRFARPDASMREVIQAAQCACIHDDIMRMPLQYKTRVGERGVTLSKGQQQRIALAQALVALNDDKKVLVLDEFTSALDSETERRLLANLRPHLAGKTVLIIAHRLSTVRSIADRIIVIENGAIAEEGSHDELIARNGWYAEMARIQAIA